MAAAIKLTACHRTVLSHDWYSTDANRNITFGLCQLLINALKFTNYYSNCIVLFDVEIEYNN